MVQLHLYNWLSVYEATHLRFSILMKYYLLLLVRKDTVVILLFNPDYIVSKYCIYFSMKIKEFSGICLINNKASCHFYFKVVRLNRYFQNLNVFFLNVKFLKFWTIWNDSNSFLFIDIIINNNKNKVLIRFLDYNILILCKKLIAWSSVSLELLLDLLFINVSNE